MSIGDGFWINQDKIKNVDNHEDVLKNTIILTRNHIAGVVANLEGENGYFPFPITREEYSSVYDFYHEKYGLEGKARELILLILTCGYNFIRFRINLQRQGESVTFGTGQVEAKTMLIARTLFKYLNSPKTKKLKDERGNPFAVKGNQDLDEKGLLFQSYQKLLDSNYTQKQRAEMFKAVPKRHKAVMRKALGIDRAESSYAKAKAVIDYQQETSPKALSMYIPSKQRIARTQMGNNWVYNVGEMLQHYGLTLVDVEKFAEPGEFEVLKEWFERKK